MKALLPKLLAHNTNGICRQVSNLHMLITSMPTTYHSLSVMCVCSPILRLDSTPRFFLRFSPATKEMEIAARQGIKAAAAAVPAETDGRSQLLGHSGDLGTGRQERAKRDLPFSTWGKRLLRHKQEELRTHYLLLTFCQAANHGT